MDRETVWAGVDALTLWPLLVGVWARCLLVATPGVTRQKRGKSSLQLDTVEHTQARLSLWALS